MIFVRRTDVKSITITEPTSRISYSMHLTLSRIMPSLTVFTSDNHSISFFLSLYLRCHISSTFHSLALSVRWPTISLALPHISIWIIFFYFSIGRGWQRHVRVSVSVCAMRVVCRANNKFNGILISSSSLTSLLYLCQPLHIAICSCLRVCVSAKQKILFSFFFIFLSSHHNFRRIFYTILHALEFN